MRPVNKEDLYDVAEGLVHTDQDIDIVLAELGFDPFEYADEVERMLWDTYRLYRHPDTCEWSIK